MGIFKGQKKRPENRIRNFYIMRYLGIVLLLLCIPFLPASVPEFHSFFRSRCWLAVDAVFLWAVGSLFERSLFRAILQDAEEQRSGGDALNASSFLFFATPLLFLFTALALVHLYAMWYAWPEHALPDPSARLQCAALAVGLFLCIYGRFLPVFSYESKWGLRSKTALRSPEQWKEVQKTSGKRMMVSGVIVTALCLFLPGGIALGVALVGAAGVMGWCYAM